MTKIFALKITKILLLTLTLLSCFACANTGHGNYYIDNTKYTGSRFYDYNYPQNFQNFNRPSSRKYRNPYQTAPKNYYPYYDYDYYYVAPREYLNIEKEHKNNNDPFLKY